jgi:DNA-binding winged helix-turn-helix (wHTH) protein/TolB-like protein/Tfp pilus assembly protein PilF
VLRFAGFELDPQRAELRGPDGDAIRLRPKSFDMLQLFAANAGRVLSKQELIEAIWPNVHVGEDGLFQCIREIRTALGDDRRQLIRLVSGRGYMFETEVSREPAGFAAEAEAALAAAAAGGESAMRAEPEMRAEPARRRFRLRGPAALVTVAGIVAVVGLAAATPIFAPDLIFARKPPTIAVMPIVGARTDPQLAQMAAGVTDRLSDGLARIDNIRVLAPRPQAASASPEVVAARSSQADFVVSGELQKEAQSWTMQARMTSSATGEVRWTTSVSVSTEDADLLLQQSRLAAGLGHPLALRINALLNSSMRSAATGNGSPTGNSKVVIEQAMAFINQTTPERFRDAQLMLEKALAAEPDNVDLEAALAAHLLRGIQSAWYNPADVAATESSAQSMLERALRAKPTYLPVLEGYCRFLTATNHFVESLIACARTLTFDPWDGLALFNLGMTEVQLGRFEEALATFKQADQFDTPQVSRWTWLLGAGWTTTLMGRNEEALPWLQRSIAITPGTGRSDAVLAAAYQRLGRTDEAKAAMARTMELRPGSTAANIVLPTKNASSVFLEANERLIRAEVEAGLPER